MSQRTEDAEMAIEEDMTNLKKQHSDPKRFEKMERRKALGRKQLAEVATVNREKVCAGVGVTVCCMPRKWVTFLLLAPRTDEQLDDVPARS